MAEQAAERRATQHARLLLFGVPVVVLTLFIIGILQNHKTHTPAPLPNDPREICQMVWNNRAGNPLVADQTYAEYMNNCLSAAQYEKDGNPSDLDGATR